MVVAARRGRRGLRRLVPFAALTVLASTVALAHASGHAADTVEYKGAFTTSQGQPIGDLPRNAITFRLSDAGLGGELHVSFPGTVDFSDSSGELCITLDINLDSTPIPVTADASGQTGVDQHVNVDSASIDGPCGSTGGKVLRSTEDGRLTAAVTNDEIVGKLDMEAFRLEFTASAFIGGAVSPTKTDLPDLADPPLLSDEPDLMRQGIAASTCLLSEMVKANKDRSKPCQALQKALNTFDDSLGDLFRSQAVIKDLETIALLANLEKADGQPVFPAVRGMMKVFAVMARNADAGEAKDQDQEALVALRRLATLVVKIDLKAVKTK